MFHFDVSLILLQICNAVVDPLPYVAACQYDLCHGGNASACNAMEAYARQCSKFDICLEWRSPDLCPAHCPAGMGTHTLINTRLRHHQRGTNWRPIYVEGRATDILHFSPPLAAMSQSSALAGQHVGLDG